MRKKKEERKERRGKQKGGGKNLCVEEKGERKANDSDSQCFDGRKSLVR